MGVLGSLVDAIAPVRCASCGEDADGDLCASCAAELMVVTRGAICGRCGAPAPRPTSSCAGCHGLGGFRVARSLLRYGGPATRLVVSLKRHGRAGLARDAGGLLAALARAEDLEGDVVTCVPAGGTARSKGFDHAELLARGVARALGVPCIRLLERTRLSGSARQADVPLAQRRENVRGRFRVRRPGTSGDVLLVDDVFTTGATAEACALALLAGGARRVDVLTLARTPRRAPRSPGGGPSTPLYSGA